MISSSFRRACARVAALLTLASAGLSYHAAAAAPAPAPAAGQCSAKTASGLGYEMLAAGTGAAPAVADKVRISYKGVLASNGQVFDQSDSAEFGVSDVIPGFSEGLRLVKAGGKIRLCVPASLGYGAAGAGVIPPNADLVFEVELFEIKAPPGPLALADRQCSAKTASGLGYTVVKPGSGTMPGDGDVALINYKGYLGATGAPFDDAGPVPVPVGQVIPGFAEGLKLMQRGGSYRLCIPAALGYGARAVGPVPANSALIFVIDLIDFKSLAEIQAAQPPQ